MGLLCEFFLVVIARCAGFEVCGTANKDGRVDGMDGVEISAGNIAIYKCTLYTLVEELFTEVCHN